MADTDMTADDLARLIGVNTRTLRRLAASGVVVKGQRGRYKRDASVTAYCEHLRQAAAGRGGDSAELTVERTKLVRAQAEQQHLRNAQARGELVDGAELVKSNVAVVKVATSRILAVPSRCGSQLPHLNKRDLAVIDRELRDALTELSNLRAGDIDGY